jgi:SAM-dependent methyltransferase
MRMTKLVVSFNRHHFAIALLACAVGIALIVLLENVFVRAFLAAGVGLAVYFMIASVIASYLIYDASDLYKLRWWPGRCLPKAPQDGIVVHAGFDPASTEIRSRFPSMHLRIFDFFDPATTTERSIQLAHAVNPSTQAEEPIAPDHWPVESASQDVVFALSAAHELRKPEERAAFFREARRVLKNGGKVIVIEQMRDLANFACFGIAAFHFLSRATWLRSFASANLTVTDEFKITPFMRAFVLVSGSL